MSFVVARMQKMKAGNLVGMGNHNQRLTDNHSKDNHSNKDIDTERSYLNYDLVNRTDNYKTDIQQFINENKSSSRAVRKDAVLINEWIITSDNQFFKDKDDKEIKDFFDTAKSYFADKFGDNNIRYAQVHLDETTPHMHLGIVPFNAEHKLTAKTVFNRQALQAVQDELPTYLQERGFELERGEKGSERKNLTVPEYKKAKDELKEMNTTLEQQKSEVLALSNDKTPTIKKESLDL
uniref:MobV family relaxase n=1 Tax=Aerococcus urinaeequi TaxID=51665 RepID=UPI0022E1DC2E